MITLITMWTGTKDENTKIMCGVVVVRYGSHAPHVLRIQTATEILKTYLIFNTYIIRLISYKQSLLWLTYFQKCFSSYFVEGIVATARPFGEVYLLNVTFKDYQIKNNEAFMEY